jgi:hypothetical protein
MRAHRQRTRAKIRTVAFAAVLVIGLTAAISSGATPAGASGTGHCLVSEVPCLGPVQVLYAFDGKTLGAAHLIHAKLGPEEQLGTTAEGTPIVRRTFTWTAAAGVKLVAAFILSSAHEHGKAVLVRGKYRWIIERITTGAHSGRATLTSDAPEFAPFLFLEGRQAQASQSRYSIATRLQAAPPKAVTAKTSCQYYSRGGPCAPIMSVYTYSDYKEGDLSLIWAKPGPEHKTGTTYVSGPFPGTYEVFKRTFAWKSIASVEIVGVYIVHEVGRGFSYKKLTSGPHGGHATLTDVDDGSAPILVLQGRRTG